MCNDEWINTNVPLLIDNQRYNNWFWAKLGDLPATIIQKMKKKRTEVHRKYNLDNGTDRIHSPEQKLIHNLIPKSRVDFCRSSIEPIQIEEAQSY